jgi:hypothetical protein
MERNDIEKRLKTVFVHMTSNERYIIAKEVERCVKLKMNPDEILNLWFNPNKNCFPFVSFH